MRPVFLAGLFYCRNWIDEIEPNSRSGCAAHSLLARASDRPGRHRHACAVRVWRSSLRPPVQPDMRKPHRQECLCYLGMSSAFLRRRASRASGEVRASRTFTDEIGRRVEIPREVDRVVSLAPNLTEIVFALGDGNHLAGDTDFCDYPPEAAQKPHVGGPVNPNLEEIVALMPDLVLATKSINRRETVDALDHIGLPVYVTDPHSVDEMIASVEHLGQRAGRWKNRRPRWPEDLRAPARRSRPPACRRRAAPRAFRCLDRPA